MSDFMSVSNQIKFWCVARELPIPERLPVKESAQQVSAPVLAEEEPSTQEILTQFEDNLQKKDPQTTMIKPEGGSTGFTFICSTPCRQKPRRFILKWDTEAAGINQKMCSDLVKHSGLSAPTIQIVTGALAKKLKRRAEKVTPAFTREDFTLIYMPSFPATTFSSARRSGYLKDLTPRNWNTVLIKSGRMLVMDLAMGNADRFFRTDWKNEKSSLKTHFNDGNLMLEMPYGQFDRVFKAVHFIDNETTPSLLKCFQKVEESDSDDDDMCLEVGGDASTEESGSDSQTKKTSPKKASETASVTSWKQTVRDLIADPKPLITVAAKGIATSFKEDAQLPVPPKKIKRLLKKGFESQVSTIKNCDLRQIERTMLAEIPKDDLHTNTFKQMMENLEIIRSSK